jgi:hypothetical protein
MTDPFAVGLFATLITGGIMFLVALISRRLEKHLDRQDARLGRIERQIVGIMVKLGMPMSVAPEDE